MSALTIENLVRTFGGVTALDDVSLTVEQGQIVGVIGPNGSGKSTLFNVLTGNLRPHGGTVRLFDRDITGWSAHRVARAGLGRTFQIPALFDNMTVRENLLTAAVEHDWAGAPERADGVVELLELGRVEHEPAGSLSGGQQRLLEMGRVLMRESRVVLLDEVAAGVHPRLRQLMVRVIRQLRDEGTTFVIIEHDMELAGDLTDAIVVMDAGIVVARGTFEEVTSDPQVMEAYLGVPIE